ncbi:MAG TPA: DinB family protein [Streptosporangiaceae bacterium]|nr:DinB family protein [Streptosporangiaceae bacterium]
MNLGELLADEFGRIREVTHRAVADLTPDQLAFRPDGRGNSIAWLIWHLTRIQDDHLADVMGTHQVWTSEGWDKRFGLPYPPMDTGYGHSSHEVDECLVESGELLATYHDAAWRRTSEWVPGLTEADLDRIVDESWDPPVTLGVRLVSVVSDDLQHAGQAAYVRGLILSR